MTNVKTLYEAALEVLRSHNDTIGHGKKNLPAQVDEEEFLSTIKLMGGTSPEALKSLSYEDILKALPEHNGIKPVALAKQIAQIWRKDNNPEGKKRPVSSKKAERMTLEELVSHFDPEEPDSPIGNRLKSISKGEPFIIYLRNVSPIDTTTTGREIDVEKTVTLLKELKQGYKKGRPTYDNKKTYCVGELPDNYAEENPLYPGRPLRPDGTCDQLNRSWEGVSKTVRQFVRMAIEHKNGIDIRGPGGRDRAHDVLDMVITHGLDKLQERYPEVNIDFIEAQKQGELPNLLIPLGKPTSNSNKKDANNPFVVGGR